MSFGGKNMRRKKRKDETVTEIARRRKMKKKTEVERVKHVQMGENKGNKGARGIMLAYCGRAKKH